MRYTGGGGGGHRTSPLHVILIRVKLATRLLGRKQKLVGKFNKWTIAQQQT